MSDKPDPSAPEEPMSAATLAERVAETLPVIEFVAPMPGFPADRHFVLIRVDEDSDLLYAMTSLESSGLRFLVAPPAPFFPDYAPEIDDETATALGLTDPANVLVLLVVNTGDAPGEATVNLMAPIVLDQATRKAVQLVLPGGRYPVRAPLLVVQDPDAAKEG